MSANWSDIFSSQVTRGVCVVPILCNLHTLCLCRALSSYLSACCKNFMLVVFVRSYRYFVIFVTETKQPIGMTNWSLCTCSKKCTLCTILALSVTKTKQPMGMTSWSLCTCSKKCTLCTILALSVTKTKQPMGMTSWLLCTCGKKCTLCLILALSLSLIESRQQAWSADQFARAVRSDT
jgi:hypothetical protein